MPTPFVPKDRQRWMCPSKDRAPSHVETHRPYSCLRLAQVRVCPAFVQLLSFSDWASLDALPDGGEAGTHLRSAGKGAGVWARQREDTASRTAAGCCLTPLGQRTWRRLAFELIGSSHPCCFLTGSVTGTWSIWRSPAFNCPLSTHWDGTRCSSHTIRQMSDRTDGCHKAVSVPVTSGWQAGAPAPGWVLAGTAKPGSSQPKGQSGRPRASSDTLFKGQVAPKH